MDENKDRKRYIPPLVSGSRLKEYSDANKTLNETGLDIGGYIRVSTAKDSQKSSIVNQQEYLKEWASINGYNLVRVYIDVKSGAFSYLRNDMNQLKEDIKSGKIKGIITKEIARTSRDVIDILELKRTLENNGAFVLSLRENYDSRTDVDEFLLTIHAALAQKERKNTASRVKVTQMQKAKKGMTNVARPAYGYKLAEDRVHLVVDEEKAKTYRFMVEKYLEGWGILRITKYLNAEGIPTSTGIGTKWGTHAVRIILTNPVYLGITIYNATTIIRDEEGKAKRVVRPQEEWIITYDTHEPLITEEEYDKIQDILKTRRESYKKEWSCEKKYLLSGLLYCEVCKGKIYGSKCVMKDRIGEDGQPYVNYTYVDQNSFGVCDTPSKYWNMKRVDDLVMAEVKKFFGDKNLIQERIKSKQYLYNKNVEKEKNERNKLQNDLDSINRAIRKQQEAYENEVISIQEYKTRLSELRERKNTVLQKIEELNIRLEKVDSIEERYNQIKDKVLKVIDNLDSLDHSTKSVLLEKIIRRIYISADFSLKIEYTFED